MVVMSILSKSPSQLGPEPQSEHPTLKHKVQRVVEFTVGSVSAQWNKLRLLLPQYFCHLNQAVLAV